MRYVFLFLAMVLLSVGAFAQATPGQSDYVFIPRTLSAGTLMSARSYTSSSDDTTQAISTDGWNRGFVHIVFSTNDSCNMIVAYQTSRDNATWGTAFTTIDSAKSTGDTGYNLAVELPAGAMGAGFIRVRVYASTAGVPFSANPSTAVTTILRLKRR
jgi:hypothetical protein